jgi:enamine deaminase RidA (YjgF/YER057c/UK114 family)
MLVKSIRQFSKFLFSCKKNYQIQRVFPKGLSPAIGPYTPVTITGSTVYVSGQIPLNP